jgi:hypothetical protein
MLMVRERKYGISFIIPFETLSFFLFLVVSGVFLISPCVAPVTMPANPSPAPEVVSVEINNNPRVVSPTYTTDPYTGEVKQTSTGSTTQNGSIVVTIKNIPFTPYTDENGNVINVYYSCRWQRSGYSEWSTGVIDNVGIRQPYVVYQSASAYTVITFLYGIDAGYAPTKIGDFENSGGSMDFRIQAVTGYFYQEHSSSKNAIFEGEGSAWTEFTVTIPPYDPYSDTNSSSIFTPDIKPTSVAPSTSNHGNSTQQNPLQSNLTIILVSAGIIALLLIVIAYLLYKQRKNKTNITQPNPLTIGTT